MDRRTAIRWLPVAGLILVSVWLAVQALQSQLTAEESAVIGTWRTPPLEDGHRTLMSLTSARRCRIRVAYADGKVRDQLQGAWSIRDGLLTVDTRSFLECLPGPMRLRGPGEIWTFALRGDDLIYAPDGPKPIPLERMTLD